MVPLHSSGHNLIPQLVHCEVAACNLLANIAARTFDLVGDALEYGDVLRGDFSGIHGSKHHKFMLQKNIYKGSKRSPINIVDLNYHLMNSYPTTYL